MFASPVFAYDLTLTKIGTMSTIGADYSLVSYTGVIPGFEGTATPAAQVTVKVNALSMSVIAATTSGVWNFTPTSLSSGDNAITVASGTQLINFVIRYNATAVPTITASPSATTLVTALPESGAWENIVYGALAGVGVIGFGYWVRRRMRIWEHGK